MCVSLYPRKPLNQLKIFTVRTFHIWPGSVHEHRVELRMTKKLPHLRQQKQSACCITWNILKTSHRLLKNLKSFFIFIKQVSFKTNLLSNFNISVSVFKSSGHHFSALFFPIIEIVDRNILVSEQIKLVGGNQSSNSFKTLSC